MRDRPAGCEARQAGGTVYCQRCRLSWDYGDEDAPMCLTTITGRTPEPPKPQSVPVRTPGGSRLKRALRKFYG